MAGSERWVEDWRQALVASQMGARWGPSGGIVVRLARLLSIGVVAALVWGAGLAIHGTPGHAQDVTEDWPDHASAAIERGDCVTALSYVNAARATGDPLALITHGGYHERGVCVPRDYDKSVAFYAQAAERDATQVLPRVGYIHLRRDDGRTDPGQAHYWFKRAALSVAKFPRGRRLMLMQLYLYDRTIPVELAREVRWLTEVEALEAPQLYDMALRVRDGEDLPIDLSAAMEWLEQAGDKGFPKAHHELGLMHLNDKYGPRKRDRGFFNLGLAAEAGYGPSQKVIAQHFAAGKYLRQRDFAAYVWLLLADESGEDVARELRDVAARLSDVEREVARQNAAEGPEGASPPIAINDD